jgi:hypothetical protein
VGGKVKSETNGQQAMLADALSLLQSALDLLDEAAAPAHIGAHVDLALHQLGSMLEDAGITPAAQGLARH